MSPSVDLARFIRDHRHCRVSDLAIALANRDAADAAFILRQVEGWQRLREKVPTWAQVEALHYPPRLSLEQCSGEPAARYKAAVVGRWWQARETTPPATMTDLTGGLGVDFAFLAPLFSTAVYVEERPELVALAQHNLPLLGVHHARCVCADALDHLRSMATADLIYLDPARRDSAGRKTVLIEDCRPDVVELLPLLLRKTRLLLLKLSPMLDLRHTIDRLGYVAEAHVFASGGECKELLLLLTAQHTGEPRIVCANEHTSFAFTPAEERACDCPLADAVEGYLYEPDAAVMKAGAYKSIAAAFSLRPLHRNTHLYISNKVHDRFPGRIFRIDHVGGFSKPDLRRITALGAANIAVRNFPASVAELRKRLKLRDGGQHYLFACTDRNEKRLLIVGEKVK